MRCPRSGPRWCRVATPRSCAAQLDGAGRRGQPPGQGDDHPAAGNRAHRAERVQQRGRGEVRRLRGGQGWAQPGLDPPGLGRLGERPAARASGPSGSLTAAAPPCPGPPGPCRAASPRPSTARRPGAGRAPGPRGSASPPRRRAAAAPAGSRRLRSATPSSSSAARRATRTGARSWTGDATAPQRRGDHGVAGAGVPRPHAAALRHPAPDRQVGLARGDRGGHAGQHARDRSSRRRRAPRPARPAPPPARRAPRRRSPRRGSVTTRAPSARATVGGGVGGAVVHDEHGPARGQRGQHDRQRVGLVQAGKDDLGIDVHVPIFGPPTAWRTSPRPLTVR